jgi:hypothetical protein
MFLHTGRRIQICSVRNKVARLKQNSNKEKLKFFEQFPLALYDSSL